MMWPGVPWWSSGWDSMLPVPRVRVPSLAGELRSHKPSGAAQKKNDVVIAKECQQPPEAGRDKKRSSLEPREGNSPSDNLDFSPIRHISDIQPPDL